MVLFTCHGTVACTLQQIHCQYCIGGPGGGAYFAGNQDLSSSDGFLCSSHTAEVLCKHGLNRPREGGWGLIMGVHNGGHNLVAISDLTAWCWGVLPVFRQDCLQPLLG